MKEIVYVISVLLISEHVIETYTSYVYKNKEKAQEHFNKIVEEERTDCEEYEWTIDVDTPTAFESSLGLDSCSFVYLEEKEVL